MLSFNTIERNFFPSSSKHSYESMNKSIVVFYSQSCRIKSYVVKTTSFELKKIQIIMACAMSCSAAAFHFTKVPFTYHIYRKKYKKIPTCSFYHCPTKYSK